MTIWKDATDRMQPGTTFSSARGKSYVVAAVDDKAITLERPETGSKVRVTRSKVEKTAARLEAGEVIPKRKIDYTVAVEEGVIMALGPDRVELTDEGYATPKGTA